MESRLWYRLGQNINQEQKNQLENLLTNAVKDLKITYEVSPPRTRIKPSKLNPNPSPKMTYEKLARIHEYGTKKIPARPHWRPTTAAFQAKAPGLSKAMQKVFLEKIDRKMARFMSSQGFGG